MSGDGREPPSPSPADQAPTVMEWQQDVALEGGEHYSLRLYVAGQTPKSTAAVANLRRICEEHLSGRYTIEVVDLLVQPQLAAGDQILAVPTLVRRLPAPLKRIIGSLADTERVLVGLDLRPGTTR